MKIAQFNDLCHREHAQDSGVVTALHLTTASYEELLAEILEDSGPVLLSHPLPGSTACGARLDSMANPATRTLVDIKRAAAFVPDTMVVTRGGEDSATVLG